MLICVKVKFLLPWPTSGSRCYRTSTGVRKGCLARGCVLRSRNCRASCSYRSLICGCLLCLTALTRPSLAGQFTSIKCRACLVVKCAKLGANLNRCFIEYVKCLIGMHSELCQAMPVRTNEQQAQDHTVVRFWEEAIKDWYSALNKDSN